MFNLDSGIIFFINFKLFEAVKYMILPLFSGSVKIDKELTFALEPLLVAFQAYLDR